MVTLSVKIDRTGYVFVNNQGCEAIVVEYKNNKEVVIEFQDKHKAKIKTTWNYIQKGSVRNPYHITVSGVGCLGVMRDGTVPKTSKNSKETREYTLWSSMIRRCYNESVLKLRPCYKDAEVCERWLVYSNFLEDLPFIEGYEYWYNNPNKKIALDKDIKGNGQKLYCLENCCFVDTSENSRETFTRLGNPMHRKENANGDCCK